MQHNWETLGFYNKGDSMALKQWRMENILTAIRCSFGDNNLMILLPQYLKGRLGHKPSKKEATLVRMAFGVTVALCIWRLILDGRSGDDISTLHNLMLRDGFLDMWFLRFNLRRLDRTICNLCGLGSHHHLVCPSNIRHLDQLMVSFRLNRSWFQQFREKKKEFDRKKPNPDAIHLRPGQRIRFFRGIHQCKIE